ncbi:MAG: tRNA 4-thiouridine(8) synthase ThiI [Candidatus Marsarchaeota archaeon]|jgi:thiamine biosynthesis protein ThiI|nr:tRNA 4-thiouridine(8) synthase ThiI [Candidatus Marsarchaeota archaeon]
MEEYKKTTYNKIVIHFGEIWMKGRNRPAFINKLLENIIISINGEKYDKIENMRDRFLLTLNNDSNINRIIDKLKYVFGISWFAPVLTVDNNINMIISNANILMNDKKNVKIIASRSFKDFKYNSYQIISKFINNINKLTFNIDKNGKNILYINITKENTFLYKEKINGVGGLPVGSSGKVVVLLSGGIDSPVAAFYAMKRGLLPIFLHVHAFSDNEAVMHSKMNEILFLLNKYYPKAKCYIIPSHYYQTSILGISNKYELVIFKHFLYMMAHKIALKENANVIVTGESIGQVASQTVKNLIATEEGIKEFIMRPLIGFDKQEIIDIAKKLNTYELSIKPYVDVCSLKVKNPSTSVDAKIVKRLYKKFNIKKVESSSLKNALIFDLANINSKNDSKIR